MADGVNGMPPPPLAVPPSTESKVTTVNGGSNGAVTRNKRMCRRKAAYKDDYTTKTVNQIKSLRLKGNANRPTRIPKLPKAPCKAGTNVVVKAKVLQEAPEGLLVMSIQWRGKDYCGCFIDTNKQGWALPRFDDPKVSSIAFLNKKAMLLASDPDDTTDDDYSPKNKRKRAAKGKKGKKRKVKNGDISNGKAKTPTKSKSSSRAVPAVTRRQSTDNALGESTDKTTPKSADKVASPVCSSSDQNSSSAGVVATSVITSTESNRSATPLKAGDSAPAIKPSDSNVPEKSEPEQRSAAPPPPPEKPTTLPLCPPKQVRTEKTATIPVGTVASSMKHPAPAAPPKTICSPFRSPFSPTSPFSGSPHQTNGALVSPLHNHSFPLIVPPPFFIPNFLQSAKFLATQTSEPSASAGGASADFSGVFAKNSISSVAGSSATNVIVSDSLSQLRNK